MRLTARDRRRMKRRERELWLRRGHEELQSDLAEAERMERDRVASAHDPRRIDGNDRGPNRESLNHLVERARRARECHEEGSA
jgi:hypothetical protein